MSHDKKLVLKHSRAKQKQANNQDIEAQRVSNVHVRVDIDIALWIIWH